METSLWLQPQLNEIVFEHRNKAYGAFTLRSGYNQTMSRSILISIGFFVLIFLGFRFYLERSSSALFEDKIVEIEKVVFLDPVYQVEKPKAKPVIKSSPAVASIQKSISPPRVVIDEKAIEVVTPPKEIEFQPVISGNSNEAPSPSAEVIDEPGQSTNDVVDDPGNATIPIYLVDQKPEFPGGNEAMYKYLKNHLSFPEMAREINVSGTVYMQFIVSATGEIEQVSVIRTPSALFNHTSIETIKGMPKWKPGIYHGKPVPVVFTLPLKFELL